MAEIKARRLVHNGWQKLHDLTIAEQGESYSREVLEMRAAVCVLPHNPTKGVVTLVRQLRAGPLLLDEPFMLIEAPAGLIDGNDTAEETAIREVEEESGLRVRAIRKVGTFWVSPGAVTERLTLFLAQYDETDRVSAGGGVENEHENIEVIEMPLTEALRMVEIGEIVDMKTAFLLAELRTRE